MGKARTLEKEPPGDEDRDVILSVFKARYKSKDRNRKWLHNVASKSLLKAGKEQDQDSTSMPPLSSKENDSQEHDIERKICQKVKKRKTRAERNKLRNKLQEKSRRKGVRVAAVKQHTGKLLTRPTSNLEVKLVQGLFTKGKKSETVMREPLVIPESVKTATEKSMKYILGCSSDVTQSPCSHRTASQESLEVVASETNAGVHDSSPESLDMVTVSSKLIAHLKPQEWFKGRALKTETKDHLLKLLKQSVVESPTDDTTCQSPSTCAPLVTASPTRGPRGRPQSVASAANCQRFGRKQSPPVCSPTVQVRSPRAQHAQAPGTTHSPPEQPEPRGADMVPVHLSQPQIKTAAQERDRVRLNLDTIFDAKTLLEVNDKEREENQAQQSRDSQNCQRVSHTVTQDPRTWCQAHCSSDRFSPNNHVDPARNLQTWAPEDTYKGRLLHEQTDCHNILDIAVKQHIDRDYAKALETEPLHGHLASDWHQDIQDRAGRQGTSRQRFSMPAIHTQVDTVEQLLQTEISPTSRNTVQENPPRDILDYIEDEEDEEDELQPPQHQPPMLRSTTWWQTQASQQLGDPYWHFALELNPPTAPTWRTPSPPQPQPRRMF